jgi:hypothetical protein
LAFSARGQILTTLIAGGVPRTIANAAGQNVFTGFAWGPDGTIVYAGIRGVSTVAADGGSPVNLISVVADEAYGPVAFLPDGSHFLVAVRSAEPAKTGTFAVALDGGERTRILELPISAQYANARLMFVRDAVLYAQAFDLSRRQLEGTAVALAESVAEDFSASSNGSVAYLPRIASQQAGSTQLSWLDRSGRVVGRIDQAGGGTAPGVASR